MKKPSRQERGLNRFFPSNAEEIKEGIVIGRFWGRGVDLGVVKKVGVRKALIRLINGKEEWVDNKELRVIKDKEWIAYTFRELKNSFPTEEEVFGGASNGKGISGSKGPKKT